MTERDNGPPVLITNLKALQKRKAGWFSGYEPVTPASLTMATSDITVSLGGSDYGLFTQPYTYSRLPASVHARKSNEWASADWYRHRAFATTSSPFRRQSS
ncbi:MAG TPA: hypothetical protein VGQ65_24880 [Thermoanaerobaculia bacterium]|nr:hypothetical protein [Thermoanaerobaculia bacterium]